MRAPHARSPSSFSRTTGISIISTKVRARGIYIPIVPGILPVQNFKQMKNFWKPHRRQRGALAGRKRASKELDDDVATRKLIAAAVAAEQVFGLVEQGVTDFRGLHDEPRRSCLRGLPSVGRTPGGKKKAA